MSYSIRPWDNWSYEPSTVFSLKSVFTLKINSVQRNSQRMDFYCYLRRSRTLIRCLGHTLASRLRFRSRQTTRQLYHYLWLSLHVLNHSVCFIPEFFLLIIFFLASAYPTFVFQPQSSAVRVWYEGFYCIYKIRLFVSFQ